jgi:pyruvate ferredoxin oxidoreductase gamma subunit
MGAPITAYNRLSDKPLRVHSNIYEPDYVAVVDETLIDSVDVTAGLKPEGAIVINTAKKPEEVIPKLKGYKGKVYTLDARKVALATIGRNIPNTPMLAAVIRASGIMGEQLFLDNMRASFVHKFATKPEVVDGNMMALSMALEEVKLYDSAR